MEARLVLCPARKDITNSLSVPFLFSEFPADCTSFNGPHTFDCINTIWTDSDCLAEGQYLNNLNVENEQMLSLLNLKYVPVIMPISDYAIHSHIFDQVGRSKFHSCKLLSKCKG